MKVSKMMIMAVAAFGLLVLTNCERKKTSNTEPVKATITGFDYRKCACCGGLLVNFQDNANSFDGTYRLISNDPAQLGIDSSTTFPVYMKVTWEYDTTKCSGNYIKLLTFEKL